MANEIQTAPSTTLADNDDWEQELNLRELSMKGYDGISLTEWAAGDTDRPQIAAGSVIEIDGAIAKFTNQTAITDEGGIADGWCYIKFVVSGADVTPTLTNTFGTWDTAKQGFYTSGARFAMFAMYRSGAVTKIYTQKHLLSRPLQLYKTEVVAIGSWDMDAAADKSVDITHLGATTVFSITGIVYPDGSTSIFYPLTPLGKESSTPSDSPVMAQISKISTTSVTLLRRAAADFDSTGYNDTAINRGWLVINYE